MDDPYKVHIDPQRATELAQSRAIILLLDVPNGDCGRHRPAGQVTSKLL